jgi:hypothetical protein
MDKTGNIVSYSHVFQRMFFKDGQNRKHCFLAMFFKGCFSKMDKTGCFSKMDKTGNIVS